MSVAHDPFLCTREIPLSRGRVALVDAADYPTLVKHRWHTIGDKNPRRQYAGRNLSRRAPPPRCLYMHRAVSSAAPADVVDHINGNTMDNRRSNLRLGTQADNARNHRAWREGRVLGCYPTKNGRWRVHVSIGGRAMYVGRYDTESEAQAVFAVARAVATAGGNIEAVRAALSTPSPVGD